MAGWFESLSKIVDDVADSFIAQANAAQDIIVAEQRKLKEEEQHKKEHMSRERFLPWETDNEALAILGQDVLERVMKVSLAEENFTIPPNRTSEFPCFDFNDFVPIAMKLLQLDANLAFVHAKLSPKMDEEIFWKHYYIRIMYIRASVGIDGTDAKESPFGSQKEEDVAIYQPTIKMPLSSSSADSYEAAAATASSSSRERGATEGGRRRVRTRQQSASQEQGRRKNDDDVCEEEEEEEDEGEEGEGGVDEEVQDKEVDPAIAVEERRRAEAALAAEVEAELQDEEALDLSDLGALVGEGDDDDDLGVLVLDDDDDVLEAQIARELAAT